MGRISTIVFVIIGCFIAPQLGNPKFKGIFNYIQEFQGFISPGILAAFLFGLFVKRTPKFAGVIALILSVPVYGVLYVLSMDQIAILKIAFLNRMAITFGVIVFVMSLITLFFPLNKPIVMPVNTDIDLTSSKLVPWLGGFVIFATICLYVVFW